MKIEPHDDDVVHMEAQMGLTGEQTVKISQLVQNLRDRIKNPTLDVWLNKGVECEFLRASEGGGWQTGKIRIRFEFIPDVPEFAEQQTED